jgi:ABC-type branched-subunit amino acid transport system substrate-binding protein
VRASSPRRCHRGRRVALAAALALLAPLAAACSSSSGEPDIAGAAAQQHGQPAAVPGFDGATIRVGVLVPSTGPLAEVAAARATGIKAYLDYVTFELGGVAGTYPIDLVVRDSSDAAKARKGYEELRSSTVALAGVEGSGTLEALLPSIEADGLLASPGSASTRWTRKANLLQIGTPDELAAANALGWLLDEHGGNADRAHVCRLVQTGADGDAWQRGLDLAASKAEVDVLATATVPAAPKAPKGVQPQIDQLKAAGCTSVLAAAGAPTLVALLSASSASGFGARWVAPAWSAGDVVASADAALQGFATEHLAVLDSGPMVDDPAGRPELLRIRDGYAPTQSPTGAYLSGYLQARALVAILTAAVTQADLSHGAVLADAARFRSLHLDDLVPDPVLGAPARRTPQDRSLVARPQAAAPSGLETLLPGYEAPFTDEVQAALLG